MRIKCLSLVLIFFFSCSKTFVHFKSKAFNCMEWIEESKKITSIIKEGNKEQFNKTLSDIKNANSFYSLFSGIQKALFEKEDGYYLEKVLTKVREIEKKEEKEENKNLPGRIFEYFRWNRMNVLGEKNYKDHIKALLYFYKEGLQSDKGIEKQERYDNLIFKLLKAYIFFSEPDRDLKVKLSDNISETEEKCDEQELELKIKNLESFLEDYKDDLKKIWNKKYIGEAISFAIKNHKFKAIKIILEREFFKEEMQNIEGILNNPLTELMQYYADKGEKRRGAGYKQTSNLKEVVETFINLIDLGAKMGNEYKNDQALFLNILDLLDLEEVKLFLEVLYEEEERQKKDKEDKEDINCLYNLVKGICRHSAIDTQASLKRKKAATRDIYYDRVIKLIEGDKNEWGEKKVSKYLREKGPYKTLKKMYTFAVIAKYIKI